MGEVTRKLAIKHDEKLEFKATSSYADEIVEYYQMVEFLASQNAISIDGEVYPLSNVEEYSIWSANEAKVYFDGKDLTRSQRDGRTLQKITITKPLFYFGKVGEVELLIGQNHLSRRIDTIEIYEDSSVTTLVLNDITDTKLNNPNSTYLDEDVFNFSQPYLSHDTIEDYWIPELNFTETEDTNVFLFQAQGSCGVYRQIDVAIAFDSSFCKFMGGFDAAVQRVQYIVALASNKYHQAGLCLSIKLAAIDGRCDVNSDVYNKMRHWKSGCLSSDGFYPDFAKYFHSQMKYIKRDAAHLFTAQSLDGPLGCSGLGSLCGYAYGVEKMSFTQDVKLQSSLFAHELGHNCGAGHNNKNGYIMNAGVNDGRYGFTSKSIKQMVSYLNTVSCLIYSQN